MKVLACLALAALLSVFAAPTSTADPEPGLPPMTSTGSGPVVGGGANAAIAQQLFSFKDPNVQEVDGTDAAGFINAAAALTNRDLATVFQPLQRALGCQTNGAGFGARAYRKTDGLWGGGMLVIAKSSVTSVDTLTACIKSGWRRATLGSPTSMCNSGWSYPPFSDTRKGEGYFVLLAGTNSDFCIGPNANFKGKASGWPN